MLRNRDKRLRQIHISFLLSGERRMNIPVIIRMCHEITNPETVVIDHADVLIPLFSAPGRQPDLRIQCLFFTGERLHAGKFLIIRRFGNIIPHFLSRCIQYHLLLYCRRNPLSPCHLGRHTPHPQHQYT